MCKSFVFLSICFLLIAGSVRANMMPRVEWVDSVLSHLSFEEKVAQLMMVRGHTNLGQPHLENICLFAFD